MTARRIWRFDLPIADAPALAMPVGARLLSAAESRTQRDCIDLWAEVDTDAPPEVRHFRVVGTGNPMPEGCDLFLDTVVTHGGAFVWHVFEATSQGGDR